MSTTFEYYPLEDLETTMLNDCVTILGFARDSEKYIISFGGVADKINLNDYHDLLKPGLMQAMHYAEENDYPLLFTTPCILSPKQKRQSANQTPGDHLLLTNRLPQREVVDAIKLGRTWAYRELSKRDGKYGPDVNCFQETEDYLSDVEVIDSLGDSVDFQPRVLPFEFDVNEIEEVLREPYKIEGIKIGKRKKGLEPIAPIIRRLREASLEHESSMNRRILLSLFDPSESNLPEAEEKINLLLDRRILEMSSRGDVGYSIKRAHKEMQKKQTKKLMRHI